MSPETLSPGALLLRGADADRARPVDLIRDDIGAQPVVPLAALDPRREDQLVVERRQGFAQGLAEGRARAARELERQSRDLAAAIDRSLDQLHQADEDRYQRLAGSVADIAVAVAEAVLGREIELAADPGGDAIRRCLDLVPDDGALIVRLHPEDVDLAEVVELVGRDVTVIPDPTLSRGDTVIAFDEGSVDGRIAQALERVREGLR